MALTHNRILRITCSRSFGPFVYGWQYAMVINKENEPVVLVGHMMDPHFPGWHQLLKSFSSTDPFTEKLLDEMRAHTRVDLAGKPPVAITNWYEPDEYHLHWIQEFGFVFDPIDFTRVKW